MWEKIDENVHDGILISHYRIICPCHHALVDKIDVLELNGAEIVITYFVSFEEELWFPKGAKLKTERSNHEKNSYANLRVEKKILNEKPSSDICNNEVELLLIAMINVLEPQHWNKILKGCTNIQNCSPKLFIVLVKNYGSKLQQCRHQMTYL